MPCPSRRAPVWRCGGEIDFAAIHGTVIIPLTILPFHLPIGAYLVEQLYEPYADNPETRGFMRIAPETLNEVIPKFMKDGWQVVSPSYLRFCLPLLLRSGAFVVPGASRPSSTPNSNP